MDCERRHPPPPFSATNELPPYVTQTPPPDYSHRPAEDERIVGSATWYQDEDLSSTSHLSTMRSTNTSSLSLQPHPPIGAGTSTSSSSSERRHTYSIPAVSVTFNDVPTPPFRLPASIARSLSRQPTYGQGALVKGRVVISRDHIVESDVKRVTVRLKGTVVTIVARYGGVHEGSTRQVFMEEGIELWNSSSSSVDTGSLFTGVDGETGIPFSIRLPLHPLPPFTAKVIGSGLLEDGSLPTMLPPSGVIKGSEGYGSIDVRISYALKVDIFRKGLKSHKRSVILTELKSHGYS